MSRVRHAQIQLRAELSCAPIVILEDVAVLQQIVLLETHSAVPLRHRIIQGFHAAARAPRPLPPSQQY